MQHQFQLTKSKKVVMLLASFMAMVFFFSIWGNSSAAQMLASQAGLLWKPMEWDLQNGSYAGNPYDLIASVAFVHDGSGETQITEMFYAGGNTWKFRFTPTRTGQWNFTTSSSDPELNNFNGTANVSPNASALGFVTQFGNKWGYTGTNEAFIPQFVMIGGPQLYYNNPSQVDDEIQTFIVEHGFNGFHVPVYCRWFDIDEDKCSQIAGSDPNPDPRTFEALELLISEAYAEGVLVHIWVWGDSARQLNSSFLPGGINGTVDKRLQRYIAARLGPLPGWTMSYGFDLFEWVSGNQLTQWHDYMQEHFIETRYLGARSNTNQLNQLSEVMDYASYEQHKPDYIKYVETIEARPHKPAFSEDRFRMRDEGRPKDYTMEETRHGLWHSAMSGGVANIWGNLLDSPGANEGLTTSSPYPNPEWIKTYSLFFENRFLKDMVRCNNLTNGVCLKSSTNAHYLFYRQNVTSIQLNLSAMNGGQPAVAVDAKKPYAEISLGTLNAANQTWTAPYSSDWAIAIGEFDEVVSPPPVKYTNFVYLPFIRN